tara:strand:+ start:589 stop:735 length:147 start_codon:yes stop_codon:yes gene_type:complete
VWRGFEDIEPELAIQKICDSHDALLELPFIFWRCQVFVVLLMSIDQRH